MKISTYAIAVAPATVLLAAKTISEPMWLHHYSFFDCLAIGVVMSLFGAIAARIIEQGG